MPRLVFIGESFAGRTYELTKERTAVGRSSQNLLAIGHPSLSREHCEIYLHGPEVIVRDLGSRNGTFVDGRMLNGSQSQVKHGQTISFGAVQAKLELEYVDPEPYESTAFHESVKYQEKPNHQLDPKKPVQIVSGESVGSIDQTVQLREIFQEILTPAKVPSPAVRHTIGRRQFFLFSAFIILLLVLLLALGR